MASERFKPLSHCIYLLRRLTASQHHLPYLPFKNLETGRPSVLTSIVDYPKFGVNRFIFIFQYSIINIPFSIFISLLWLEWKWKQLEMRLSGDVSSHIVTTVIRSILHRNKSNSCNETTFNINTC